MTSRYMNRKTLFMYGNFVANYVTNRVPIYHTSYWIFKYHNNCMTSFINTSLEMGEFKQGEGDLCAFLMCIYHICYIPHMYVTWGSSLCAYWIKSKILENNEAQEVFLMCLLHMRKSPSCVFEIFTFLLICMQWRKTTYVGLV